MKRTPVLILLPLLFSSLLIFSFFHVPSAETIRIGARGDEVLQLQEKLSSLGLFTGVCGGVYDRATSDAVRRFQLANGLKGSGVCDSATLSLLLLPSEKEETQREYLAAFLEERCEACSFLTKCAYGAVIVNRTESDSFPPTLLSNLLNEGWTPGGILPSSSSLSAAAFALAGGDPTDGALYLSDRGKPLPEKWYPTLVTDGFTFGK